MVANGATVKNDENELLARNAKSLVMIHALNI